MKRRMGVGEPRGERRRGEGGGRQRQRQRYDYPQLMKGKQTHLTTIAADTLKSRTNVARKVYTGDGRHASPLLRFDDDDDVEMDVDTREG